MGKGCFTEIQQELAQKEIKSKISVTNRRLGPAGRKVALSPAFCPIRPPAGGEATRAGDGAARGNYGAIYSVLPLSGVRAGRLVITQSGGTGQRGADAPDISGARRGEQGLLSPAPHEINAQGRASGEHWRERREGLWRCRVRRHGDASSESEDENSGGPAGRASATLHPATGPCLPSTGHGSGPRSISGV